MKTGDYYYVYTGPTDGFHYITYGPGLLKKGISTSLTYNFNSVVGLEAFFQHTSGHVISTRDVRSYGVALLPFGSGIDHVTVTKDTKLNRTDMPFLAGPRFAFRNSSRVTPFVHGLVGFSRNGGSEHYVYQESHNGVMMPDQSGDFDFKGNTSFSFALGCGLDIPINDSVAIRAIQADYYRTTHDDYWALSPNNLNLSFGVVFRFGR